MTTGVIGGLPRRRLRWAPAIGVLAASVAALLCTVTWTAAVLHQSLGDQLTWQFAWISYVAIGALVLRRRPELPVGWVLIATGALVQLAALADGLAVWAEPGRESAAALAALASELVFLPVFPLAGAALLLLLPSGRVEGQWGRRLVAATGWLVAVALVGYAVRPGPLDSESLPNPLGLTQAPWLATVLLTLAWLGLSGCALTAVVRLIARWRRAHGQERRALAYVATGGVVAVGQFGSALLLARLGLDPPAAVRDVALVALIATLPATVGLAILHGRLLDIELVLRRGLTYLLMSAAVVGVYALTVVLVGQETSQRGRLGTSLLISGAAAVGLSPLRERAQRQVDRLLYGRRADPYGVVRDIDAAAAQARTPAAVLESITATVANALKLPYVAVEIDGRRSGHGSPRPLARELALTHYGRRVGILLLAPRSVGEDFSSLDDRLLLDVAEHIGSAVAAVTLAEEAQRSRERLVHVLEDDRRRIRRDLHDQLGPVLSGITLQLDALRRLTAGNDEAQSLAGTVRAEVAEAVVDVRRLVHDLRPPVLDELGLAEALRQFADRLTGSLSLLVDVEPLPPLPAAVEVAVYRIATEALTNTVRHSGATRAGLTMRVQGDRLRLDVTDDGCGIDGAAPPGVGLVSMGERVAELGGRLAVGGTAPGTQVTVELPL